MKLLDVLRKAGYEPPEEKRYLDMELWRAWYRGKVRGFHNYTIYSGGRGLSRTRAGLNMAKQGAEYWANLLWNRDCAINLENPEADTLVRDVLEKNEFTGRTNALIEQAFALGTGAYVVFATPEGIQIDTVAGNMIYPLEWTGNRVTSCAFAGRYAQEGKRMLYLMIHARLPEGGYRITNRYFQEKAGGTLAEAAPPGGVLPEYFAAKQRYALLRPAIADNRGEGPLGLSIYANCLDTLQAIDLAYDGAKTAMEIGRPRIGVTAGMLKMDRDSGELREVFDARDIAVYDMGSGLSDEAVSVTDLTTPYRAAEFERSLQAQLTVYAQCIGLGERAFRWEPETVRTATEVIASGGAMLRAMEKHQAGLEETIRALAGAVLDTAGFAGDIGRLHVAFDDSVTRDKGLEARDAWEWVLNGKMAFGRYLVLYKGFDEREAQKIDEEAARNHLTARG